MCIGNSDGTLDIQAWTNPAGTGYTTPPTLLDAGDVTVVVKDVKNPSASDLGLGNFGIKTYSNAINLVDSNINFGFFALSPSYNSFFSVLI